MNIGDSVIVAEGNGTLVECLYSIECWWEKGSPPDSKVLIKLDDGRVVKRWTSQVIPRRSNVRR